jgi:arylsulfatase A-like enzyme
MTGLHTGTARSVTTKGGFGARPLGPSDVTVAQILKQAGFTTAIIGKWDSLEWR